jgi:hypothetical protein
VPTSKIAALAFGVFVSRVVNDPHQEVRLKMFHGKMLPGPKNPPAADFRPLFRHAEVSPQKIADNFQLIKLEIKT